MFKHLLALCILLAGPAGAQEKIFGLTAPETLIESGFLRHLLPRFSLKTGIRIALNEGEIAASFGDTGTPVFRDSDRVWHLTTTPGPFTDVFAGWLVSDVGKRTIEAFAPEGTALFSADVGADVAVVEVEITGDVTLGEEVSLSRCGRCHVVNDSNRMNAIGSTPSFALLRTFEDWQGRFQSFFALKPHPAFTQVTDVTAPFPENLPSPIAPIEVTLDELDAIIAYVATIAPADLGSPIQSQ